MIRVLHVINSLAAAGAETLLVQLCRRLPEEGVSPVVASLLGPGALSPLFEEHGIPTVDLSRAGEPGVWAVAKLVRAIRRYRIHVVHTHLAYAGVAGKLAAMATRRPVVTTRHYTTDPKLNTLPYRLEDWLTGHGTARVVVISDYMRRIILAERLAKPERVVVHRNAIDVAAFRSRCRPSLRGEGPVVGTVGRMEPQKAQEIYLEAMALIRRRVPSVRGMIVGDGRRRSELEGIRRRLDLDERVAFVGSVPPDDVPTLLGGFDLFVLSSDWEGLPLVLIEAAALGLPTVATDVGAVSEVVREGRTGFLVPPRDLSALAEAALKILEDAEKGREFGANARACAEAEFDIARLARQTATLYRDVLAERGQRPCAG